MSGTKGHGRRLHSAANPQGKNPVKIMRRRRERRTNIKVRFDSSVSEAGSGLDSDGDSRKRVTPGISMSPLDSFGTVTEAKGAVSAQCFKNPMRGGYVLSNPETSYRRASGPAQLDKVRTSATTVYTLRRDMNSVSGKA